MVSDSSSQQRAQLDKREREHLEDFVEDLRERVEDNIRFQLTQKGLDEEPEDPDTLDEDTQKLVDAIQLESVDGHSWEEAFEQYVTGVGYTIINRLSALRCMEVRSFIEEEVTVFKDSGLTPAAETLVQEEFLLEDEAILQAYHNECDKFSAEIEILFDTETPYSQVDPDGDTFEELCRILDKVSDEVWRADDVLGWIYEYYNASQLSNVRERMRTGQFDAEDVAVANQFYTPQWVARLLTDNAVAKPYLKSVGRVDRCIEEHQELTPSQRIERDTGLTSSPSIADFSTYIVPTEGEEMISYQHPSEIQILDPACGSGHFLLYAFDVLERIWRDATEIQHQKIPEKILKHNLYGIDIDMRACQLAAFNLYLKARRRAEIEGNDTFQMPSIGIVCADNHITDIDQAYDIIETLAEANSDFANALETVLKDFRNKKGLGSLLDVKGTLESETASDQTALSDWTEEIPSLPDWIEKLHEEVEEDNDVFLYQNLQSFLRIILLLTKDYDTILMNPPYGGHRRMPKQVKEYIQDHYEFKPEYYVNFLEQSGRLLKPHGQIGMLVPRSFMYKESFSDVRQELIEHDGDFDFDFLVEFGKGVLDNATVRTVGTVLTKQEGYQETGEFIQLSDVSTEKKEHTFVQVLNNVSEVQQRHHSVNIDEFRKIPGGMLTYWTPPELRELYTNNTILDAEQAGLDRAEIGAAKKGIDTGNNSRFVRKSWECDPNNDQWHHYAKGGERSWFYYPDKLRVLWGKNGSEISRYDSSTIRNRDYQGRAAVTWPLIKDSGHRFAQFDSGGISDNGGPCFYPDSESIEYLTALLNSTIYNGLMLAQTPERQWNLSDIAILPYFDISAESRSKLEALSGKISDLVHQFESFRLQSGHYSDTLSSYEDLNDFIISRTDTIEQLLTEMEQHKKNIDSIVAAELNINEKTLEAIKQEATLRYGDFDLIPYNKDDIYTDDESFCKRLLSHLVLVAIENTEDGIIDISTEFTSGNVLYDNIISQLEILFDASAEKVLAEMDGNLGTRSAETSPYPNIKYWIENSFFEAHLSAFENTPIIWKLTTSRLVSDPIGEGFSCLVDYDEIDPALFDRLQTQYLEPKKAELRERRNNAERRRNDESLTASEKAEAAEDYDRYNSGLQQIAQFEETVQDLLTEQPRNWTDADREQAEILKSRVSEFRQQTQEYIDRIEKLNDFKEKEWFENRFSPTFLETVKNNKNDWIDTLTELESACGSYSRSAEKPVKAHYYDLFTYFPDVIGSDHFASNGILFMTYYFEREGEEYLDKNGRPREGLVDREAKILAELASDLDQYKSLANKIESSCNDLLKKIQSDWEKRAITEITTAGYRPNKKHGVAVNIKPLSEAEIVPKSVDERVLE